MTTNTIAIPGTFFTTTKPIVGLQLIDDKPTRNIIEISSGETLMLLAADENYEYEQAPGVKSTMKNYKFFIQSMTVLICDAYLEDGFKLLEK